MHISNGFKKIWLMVVLLMTGSAILAQAFPKPRVLISTDIGGTDPDDNQSMIHLLMYANQFQLEGFVSTAFKGGSVNNIHAMIVLYEKDLPKLASHEKGFPSPAYLQSISKQGTRKAAPFKGYTNATEGSDWIISCARKPSTQPLWVLIWGGLEDLAQALHDAPDIEQKIKVYWIGGPNKKWGPNAYHYIATHHPNLWIIENNATSRGWFLDQEAPENLTGKNYYNNYIKGRGQMGLDFVNYYKGQIKMGDTPSLAYLLFGNPNDPTAESWGGSFATIRNSAHYIFHGNSSVQDSVSTYAILEWHFKGPTIAIPQDSICFNVLISGQKWPGYYLGNGLYAFRYAPKQEETATYVTESAIPALNGLLGSYVSRNPWPGKANVSDYLLGKHWYSDLTDKSFYIGEFQGAKTISKHRKAYLEDWAKRWEWLQ